MGIATYTSSVLMREALYKPFSGDVLVIGRQTIYFSAEEALAVARQSGLDVGGFRAEDLDLDFETRIGMERANGQYISDRAYLSLLGVAKDRLTFLDHSSYEGASVIVDLNEPAPIELAGKFDLVIDGGCFDNVFNPAQALKNCAMFLRPGGRLITFNMYTNHFDPYTILTGGWFVDYFAVNHFENCHVYFICFQDTGAIAVYTPDLARSVRGFNFNNFASAGSTEGIAIWVVAEKGRDSTWHKSPSQRIYRDEAEWQVFEEGIEIFLSNPRPYSARSVGGPAVTHPPYREYLFVDEEGQAWGIHEYQEHARRLEAAAFDAPAAGA